MVKMIIGEVQTQSEQIKSFGSSYSAALEAVSSATQAIAFATGMSGKGMDSIKNYLSSAYPALCKAAIMYSESMVQANEAYVKGYTSECGSEDLDSEELEQQIQEINHLIGEFQSSIDNLERTKNSLSDKQLDTLGSFFQGMSATLSGGLARNEAKKKKLEEKLEKFLNFCGKSTSYFEGVSDTLLTSGMTALGVDSSGNIGTGSWNGNGFSLKDTSWIKDTDKQWNDRIEKQDKELLKDCKIIRIVDEKYGLDYYMLEKDGHAYRIDEKKLSADLAILAKKYGIDVLDLTPEEAATRVNNYQKSGKDYMSGNKVGMPGVGLLAHGQDLMDRTKKSGVWDAVWSVGLTVAAVRNAQTYSQNTKKLNEFNIEKIRHQLKTDKDTAFFWSGRTEGVGGADIAASVAKNRGGVTLETTIESKNIKMPEWDFNKPSSMKAWDLASGAYAEQVSGEIRAVIGSELRSGNIWENVELPRLKNNPEVKKITTIDPKTGIEKIIFERK